MVYRVPSSFLIRCIRKLATQYKLHIQIQFTFSSHNWRPLSSQQKPRQTSVCSWLLPRTWVLLFYCRRGLKWCTTDLLPLFMFAEMQTQAAIIVTELGNFFVVSTEVDYRKILFWLQFHTCTDQ